MKPEISEIEKEAKNLLTKQEFEELKKFFIIGPASFVQQINKYFDTEDFKIKNTLPVGTTLRMRNKKGTNKIELKLIADDGTTPEYADELSDDELEELFENGNLPGGNTRSKLSELDVSEPFIYLGDLETLRSEPNANNSYEASIFLDESHLPGGVIDYEIEVESDDYQKSQTILDTILHQFLIPRRETPRKIERFYKAIGL